MSFPAHLPPIEHFNQLIATNLDDDVDNDDAITKYLQVLEFKKTQIIEQEPRNDMNNTGTFQGGGRTDYISSYSQNQGGMYEKIRIEI